MIVGNDAECMIIERFIDSTIDQNLDWFYVDGDEDGNFCALVVKNLIIDAQLINPWFSRAYTEIAFTKNRAVTRYKVSASVFMAIKKYLDYHNTFKAFLDFKRDFTDAVIDIKKKEIHGSDN